MGTLALGLRWTGEVYDDQDVRLIGILARQAALSILNARQLERLQATAQLVLQAEENERRKIARELHDTILQFLLVLTYGLDDLKERQAAQAAEDRALAGPHQRQAGQLRNLLSYLHVRSCSCSKGWCARCKPGWTRCGKRPRWSSRPTWPRRSRSLLSTEAKVTIYRACREAVHNEIKHSGGAGGGEDLA